jgi:DNA-binding response OmpR family regulator
MTVDNRQQTADNRQQTPDTRQQTAGSRQQAAGSRQQAAGSRQQHHALPQRRGLVDIDAELPHGSGIKLCIELRSWRYSDVTVTLQWCCSIVTKMLQ